MTALHICDPTFRKLRPNDQVQSRQPFFIHKRTFRREFFTFILHQDNVYVLHSKTGSASPWPRCQNSISHSDYDIFGAQLGSRMHSSKPLSNAQRTVKHGKRSQTLLYSPKFDVHFALIRTGSFHWLLNGMHHQCVSQVFDHHHHYLLLFSSSFFFLQMNSILIGVPDTARPKNNHKQILDASTRRYQLLCMITTFHMHDDDDYVDVIVRISVIWLCSIERRSNNRFGNSSHSKFVYIFDMSEKDVFILVETTTDAHATL